MFFGEELGDFGVVMVIGDCCVVVFECGFVLDDVFGCGYVVKYMIFVVGCVVVVYEFGFGVDVCGE